MAESSRSLGLLSTSSSRPTLLPDINYAVEMDIELEGQRTKVMAEVALQIGEGRVRCICLRRPTA